MPDPKQVRNIIFFILGIVLIVVGVSNLIEFLYSHSAINNEKLAVAFLLVMLGFSFCYPGLLRDENNRLSTMRIVVFMMVNVICLLFVKEGWGKGLTTANGLMLNAYWMGIVAFVFGAKATQSYFENKFSDPQLVATTPNTPDNTVTNVPESIIQEAIKTNIDQWIKQYNVVGVGVGKKRINGLLKDVNCLVFKPAAKTDPGKLPTGQMIPGTIAYKATNGNTYSIPTDVQQTGGPIRTSYVQPTSQNTCAGQLPKQPGCSVSRLVSNIAGTIGPLVYYNSVPHILSCFHVLCEPELSQGLYVYSSTNSLDSRVISPGSLDNGTNTNVIGTTAAGKLNAYMDGAIAKINDPAVLNAAICMIGMTPSSTIDITSDHVQEQYVVQTVGRTSGFQKGIITSSFCSATVQYTINSNWTNYLLNGLLSCTRISDEGDSGAAVVDEYGHLVGILVATAPNESYIIPGPSLLSAFNITLTP
jgi:hypothetical protein